jgi:TonB-linked SusC/RagA family outer membrane protein
MNKVLLSFFLLLFLSVTVMAQNRQITGHVVEKGNKIPVVAASVTVKGTKGGTLTDINGTFKMSIPNNFSTVLVITSIGYTTREVTVNANDISINVELEANSQQLNEVVAIGYQTVKRRDLTGAVSSVGAKDLKDIPLNSAADALEGRLAGVQITIADGQPGAQADIYIRGRSSITQSGQPLYIVDGVELDNALSIIAPQDIESIDVLKDAASTSIYGSRGSNGVIVITTKGGKNTNGRTSVTYNTTLGIQKLPKELSLMDPYNFLLYQYERAKYTNGDTSFVTRFIKRANNFDTLKNFRNTPAVDWQKETLGRNAFFQSHNLSISGGTDKTQFNLSATYNGQQGLLVHSDYNRELINFRFNHKVSDRFSFGFNTKYNNQVVNGNGTADPSGAGSNNLRQLVRYQPLLSPGQGIDTYDNALSNLTSSNGLNLIDPLSLLAAEYRKNTTIVTDLNANATLIIVPKFSLRTVIGYNTNSVNQRAFDDTVTSNSVVNGNKLPIATVATGYVRTINNSNVFEYNNSSFLHSKHGIDILAGQETFQTYSTNTNLQLKGIPVGTTPDEAFANYALGTAQPPTSSETPVHILSFFSRISYNYNEKYLLTLNYRADGSSVFGPARKWGYFPSASAAWRITQEDFMKNQTIVDDAKLRLSYGSVGNSRITPFSYATNYSTGRNYYLNGILNLGTAPSSSLSDPFLQWETQISRNLGVDLSFFKGRLQVTADFYRNTTNNLLLNNAIPPVGGYTTQLQNEGSVANHGMEFQLSGTILQSKAFRWTGNFNVSFNTNTIESLGGQQSFTFNSGWFSSQNAPNDFLVKVGEQVGSMYGLVSDGYYKLSDFSTSAYSNASFPWATTKYTLNPGVPTSSISTTTVGPGTPKFKDLNGDGVINGSDFTVIGHALPKFIGGFNQQFTYKNFDASIFLNFSYGNQVYNYNKAEFGSGYSVGANLLSAFNDRWHIIDPASGVQIQGFTGTTAIGASPDVIGAVNGNPKYGIPPTGIEWTTPSSADVEDGSFLRINNITLGYTLPKSLLSVYGISSLRVYVTGNNLATITGYSGYDPDVSSRRNSPLTPGVDYSAYPKARTFLFGLNVTF